MATSPGAVYGIWDPVGYPGIGVVETMLDRVLPEGQRRILMIAHAAEHRRDDRRLTPIGRSAYRSERGPLWLFDIEEVDPFGLPELIDRYRVRPDLIVVDEPRRRN